jgi:hypothetical protein
MYYVTCQRSILISGARGYGCQGPIGYDCVRARVVCMPWLMDKLRLLLGRRKAVMRRHYVFSLRDELPLAEDGWNVIVHSSECPRRKRGNAHVLTCNEKTCRGIICRFFQIAGESETFIRATLDLSEGAKRLGCEPKNDTASSRIPSMPVFRSVIAASAPYQMGEDTGEHFERCFKVAFEAGKALRIATRAPIPHITTERLWPLYFIVHEEPPRRPEVHNLVIIEHGQLPGGATATREQLELAERIFGAGWNGDPVEIYRDFELSAQNASYATGDYVQAILSAATASEVLIKHASWMLTWEATTQLPSDPGSAATDSETMNGKPSQLIGRILQRRLGGSWDSKSPTRPVGAWREHIARRRNAIIHSGHRPSTYEVQDAIAALHDIEQHILNRLAAKAADYPRTNLLLLGQGALERRGAWSMVQSTASSGDRQIWLADYRRWLATVALTVDAD